MVNILLVGDNDQTSLWMTQTKTIADAGSTPAGSTIFDVSSSE